MITTRKRSCNACRIAKTKCNVGRPKCFRCETKKLRCRYEGQEENQGCLRQSEPLLQRSWLLATKACSTAAGNASKPSDSLSLRDEVNVAANSVEYPRDTLITSMNETENDELLTWFNYLSGTMDTSPLPSAPIHLWDYSSNLYTGFEPRSLAPSEDTQKQSLKKASISVQTEESADTDIEEFLNIGDSNRLSPACIERGAVSLSTLPTGFGEPLNNVAVSKASKVKLLSRRPISTISKQIAAEHVWATLRAYIAEFCKNQSVPFIHNRLFMRRTSSDISKSAFLPEPLANCAILVPLYLNKSPTNTPFILRTLFHEALRLHNEVGNSVALIVT